MRFLAPLRQAYKVTHLSYPGRNSLNYSPVTGGWEQLRIRCYGSKSSGNSKFFKNRKTPKKYSRDLSKYKQGSTFKRRSSRSFSNIAPVAVITNVDHSQKIALIPINLFEGKRNDEEAFEEALAIVSLLRDNGRQVELFADKCTKLKTGDRLTQSDDKVDKILPQPSGRTPILTEFEEHNENTFSIKQERSTAEVETDYIPKIPAVSFTTENYDLPAKIASQLREIPVSGMELNFEMDMTNVKDALLNLSNLPALPSKPRSLENSTLALSTNVRLDSEDTKTIPLHFNALIQGIVQVNPKDFSNDKLKMLKVPQFNEYVTAIAANLCSTALQRGFPTDISRKFYSTKKTLFETDVTVTKKNMLKRYDHFKNELNARKAQISAKSNDVGSRFEGHQQGNDGVEIYSKFTTTQGLLDCNLYRKSLEAAARERKEASRSSSAHLPFKPQKQITPPKGQPVPMKVLYKSTSNNGPSSPKTSQEPKSTSFASKTISKDTKSQLDASVSGSTSGSKQEEKKTCKNASSDSLKKSPCRPCRKASLATRPSPKSKSKSPCKKASASKSQANSPCKKASSDSISGSKSVGTSSCKKTSSMSKSEATSPCKKASATKSQSSPCKKASSESISGSKSGGTSSCKKTPSVSKSEATSPCKKASATKSQSSPCKKASSDSISGSKSGGTSSCKKTSSMSKSEATSPCKKASATKSQSSPFKKASSESISGSKSGGTSPCKKTSSASKFEATSPCKKASASKSQGSPCKKASSASSSGLKSEATSSCKETSSPSKSEATSPCQKASASKSRGESPCKKTSSASKLEATSPCKKASASKSQGSPCKKASSASASGLKFEATSSCKETSSASKSEATSPCKKASASKSRGESPCKKTSSASKLEATSRCKKASASKSQGSPCKKASSASISGKKGSTSSISSSKDPSKKTSQSSICGSQSKTFSDSNKSSTKSQIKCGRPAVGATFPKCKKTSPISKCGSMKPKLKDRCKRPSSPSKCGSKKDTPSASSDTKKACNRAAKSKCESLKNLTKVDSSSTDKPKPKVKPSHGSTKPKCSNYRCPSCSTTRDAHTLTTLLAPFAVKVDPSSRNYSHKCPDDPKDKYLPVSPRSNEYRKKTCEKLSWKDTKHRKHRRDKPKNCYPEETQEFCPDTACYKSSKYSKKGNKKPKGKSNARPKHLFVKDVSYNSKEGSEMGNDKVICSAAKYYCPLLMSASQRCHLSTNARINQEATIEAPYKITMQNHSIPRIFDNDILVAVDSVALSDSDIYMFETGAKHYKEVTLGNEAAGVVQKIGRNVHHVKIGDHVAIESAIPCRRCDLCKKGHYNLCSRMIFNRCLSKYCIHPGAFCYKISKETPLERAAMVYQLALGCNACHQAGIKPNSNVVIIGSCAMTVCAAICAHSMGASNICVMCGSPNTEDIIEEFVTNKVVYFNGKVNECALVEKIFNSLGTLPDIVINCSSCTKTMNAGIMTLKPTGTCVIAGFHSECASFNIMDALMKEIRIIPSYRSKNMFPLAINLLESGRAPIDGLIAACCRWDELEAAFRTALSEGNSGPRKVIVQCQVGDGKVKSV